MMRTQNTSVHALQAIVIGNVAFDVLCYPVDDVPRYRSMTFEQSEISPGGCGSNSAIGLACLGIKTALVASIGDDQAGELAMTYWHQYGVETSFVKKNPESKTGVSVGLVDSNGQPRFVHTSGANASLQTADCDLRKSIWIGDGAIHIAGYFLLPGLLNDEFPELLKIWQHQGIFITMDVAQTPRMEHPEPLWKCLPYVDVFFCNSLEAKLLTGVDDHKIAGATLLANKVKNVVIKLGAEGCLLMNELGRMHFQGITTHAVDTTGAGDAFAAGFIADYLSSHDIVSACEKANQIGSNAVSKLGALAAWM